MIEQKRERRQEKTVAAAKIERNSIKHQQIERGEMKANQSKDRYEML